MQDSSRATVIAFVVIAVAIIAGIILITMSRPEPVTIAINPPPPTATAQPTATPAPLVVYVTGSVADSETTVTVPAGSRVRDAIDAAGGALNDADLSRVNLAGILRDGDHVHVPSTMDNAAVPTPLNAGIVYVNTATVDELVMLPGVGEAIAERIINYREENGPFASLADLDEISGIGPAMLEEIAEKVSFD